MNANINGPALAFSRLGADISPSEAEIYFHGLEQAMGEASALISRVHADTLLSVAESGPEAAQHHAARALTTLIGCRKDLIDNTLIDRMVANGTSSPNQTVRGFMWHGTGIALSYSPHLLNETHMGAAEYTNRTWPFSFAAAAARTVHLRGRREHPEWGLTALPDPDDAVSTAKYD